MAQAADGTLIDLHGGRDDLDALLRHVTPAFVEIARVLRIARFAAKLGQFGFRVAHDTHRLMRDMVQRGDMAHLSAERTWREMLKAMDTAQPWRFFEVLQRCGALASLLPAVNAAMGEAGATDTATVRRLPVEAHREGPCRPAPETGGVVIGLCPGCRRSGGAAGAAARRSRTGAVARRVLGVRDWPGRRARRSRRLRRRAGGGSIRPPTWSRCARYWMPSRRRLACSMSCCPRATRHAACPRKDCVRRESPAPSSVSDWRPTGVMPLRRRCVRRLC